MVFPNNNAFPNNSAFPYNFEHLEGLFVPHASDTGVSCINSIWMGDGTVVYCGGIILQEVKGEKPEERQARQMAAEAAEKERMRPRLREFNEKWSKRVKGGVEPHNVQGIYRSMVLRDALGPVDLLLVQAHTCDSPTEVHTASLIQAVRIGDNVGRVFDAMRVASHYLEAPQPNSGVVDPRFDPTNELRRILKINES